MLDSNSRAKRNLKAKKRIKRIRQDVIARDGSQCCYCDTFLSKDEITMEHIVPESQKGMFNSTNLTVACHNCNNKRGDKPFFEYCKKFNWPNNKLKKYENLYLNNLKIKILNLSKEVHLKKEKDIPDNLINKSCELLKIKKIDYNSYIQAYQLDFDLSKEYSSQYIRAIFQKLIKIIEGNSY